MAIDVVADWYTRLLGRHYEQFKDKPKLNALVQNVIAFQLQDIEDALQTMLTLPSIDDSFGAQLDLLGRLIGQDRGGVDDDTYRLYLRARIAANRSDGTPEALFRVFTALFGIDTTMLYSGPAGADVATFRFQITSPGLTDAEALIAAAFLFDAKAAGVRSFFEWQPAIDSLMFYMALSTTIASAASATDTSITVDDTSDFPSTGSIEIDGGLAAAETVTFTVVDGTTMTVSALANNHSIGAEVELVGDTGLGFDDASSPGDGGEFAGATGVP